MSGVVWHPRLKRLFTVHDGNTDLAGAITAMDLDGTAVQTWVIGGDLEGITVADPSSDFVYIAKEQPNDSILEFDFVLGVVTRVWDLTSMSGCTAGCELDGVPFPDASANNGIEGITFVPDEAGSGGIFLLGLETDGRIYQVRLNLDSATGEYNYLGHAARLGPWAGEGGSRIQGLHYDASNDVLWALIGQQRLRVMKPDGSLLVEWSLPEPDGWQEGITFANDACRFVIAWDDGEGGVQNRLRTYGFRNCTKECSIAVPDPLEAGPNPFAVAGGGDLNRVGGFAMPASAGGQEVAIRITLADLYIDTDIDPVNGCPVRTEGNNLSLFDGKVRYLGPPSAFDDNDTLVTPKFIAAELQCTPFYRDWTPAALTADFGTGVSTDTIYYYGKEVFPCSVYEAQQAIRACVESANEDCFSTSLEIRTALWGDVWPPFGNISFTDIGKIVDAFKNIPFVPGSPPDGAPRKVRAMLRENSAPFGSTINFSDIGRVVDAFKTIAYAEDGPESCP